MEHFMYSSCDVRVEHSLFPPVKSPFFTGAISLNHGYSTGAISPPLGDFNQKRGDFNDF